jgi:hypothetical protein
MVTAVCGASQKSAEILFVFAGLALARMALRLRTPPLRHETR